MNVVLMIDNLGSGGAERQCVALAISLKQRNYDVVILGYTKGDHFLKEVNNQDIDYYLIEEDNPIKRILKFRKKIKRLVPNVIIAFLRTPSLLAVLSSIPVKPWRLIVSERNNLPFLLSIRNIITLQFYRIADYVTTNAENTTEALIQQAPYLRKRIKTIYNGLDLWRFSPCKNYPYNRRKILVVISSHQKHKNAINLILAMNKLKNSNFSQLPIIYWYGSDVSYTTGVPCDTYLITRRLIENDNLQEDFILHDPVIDVENIYRKADALILCSFWEGLPNAVCEAMACGLPILMSTVSDYKVLTEGNGNYFDPHSVDSIADVISWFCSLNENEIISMRAISREKAEILFPIEKMVDSYVKLIESC